jgi:hypothetical protein
MAQIPLNTQFIGLASTVNTTERRSATINAESAAYTMQDIVDTIPSGPAYKVYTARLTQAGTNAPVPTVLENTLGVIPTYSYLNAGQYIISGITPSSFDTSKVFIIAQGGSVNAISNIIGGGPDVGKIQILNYDTTGTLSNSGGNAIYLEIRVYP